MGPVSDEDTTVLIVDDETDLLEAYELMLADAYNVVTAANGDEALEAMHDEIDVVFLDRRMPGMSGDELLDELREQGYGVPVAMVTAVEPDDDIIEMPFDDYLTKPVNRELLSNKVEILANRASFDQKSREFYRLASKKATLEAKDTFDHTESGEYQRLVDHMEELRADLDETLDELVAEDPEAAFRSL
ncbi:MAG: DNA-binding response OmpR family regulator [Haloarculaceae archaeon]|jgi:DNA-binding response OmpR family regulator